MDKPKHSGLPDSFLVLLAIRGEKPAEVTEPEDSQEMATLMPTHSLYPSQTRPSHQLDGLT